MSTIVFYHKSCADGFGAAVSAWTHLGDNATYHAVAYGDVKQSEDVAKFLNRNPKEDVIYILDFSFPMEVMLWLVAHCRKVVWLDHHKTAFEMWCQGVEEYPTIPQVYEKNVYWGASPLIILDNNRSGAVISWEFFNPGIPTPLFIQHIDDHDRWQFKLPETKQFMKALWAETPWSFSQWIDWFYDCENKFEHSYWRELFYVRGEAILKAHQQNVEGVVKGAAMTCYIHQPDIQEDLVGLVANCPPNLTSDVGHELANQSGTYGLLWRIDKEGICQCSLRSNGDYDVSAIAKLFGGGGHKNAAGFQVPLSTLLSGTKIK